MIIVAKTYQHTKRAEEPIHFRNIPAGGKSDSLKLTPSSD